MNIFDMKSFYTGLLLLGFTAIISIGTIYIKNKYDRKNQFEKIASDKLEKAINGLIFELKTFDNNRLNEAVINIIKEHGHLITYTVYIDLLELVHINNCLINVSIDANKYFEYLEWFKKLREQIISELMLEQQQLIIVKNTNFDQYMHKTNSSNFENIFNLVSKLSETIASIFIFITGIGIILVTSYDEVLERFENPILNFLYEFVLFLFLSILLIGLIKIVIKISDPFLDTIYSKKNKFTPHYKVKIKGDYKCLICSDEIKMYSGLKLPYCNHQGKKMKFLDYFKIYTWERIDS